MFEIAFTHREVPSTHPLMTHKRGTVCVTSVADRKGPCNATIADGGSAIKLPLMTFSERDKGRATDRRIT